MTDSTSPTTPAAQSVGSQIDALVAHSASGLSSQGINVQQDSGGYVYNTDSGVLTVNGNPSQVQGRIHDTGQDIDGAVSAIQGNIARLEGQINAVTYDKSTGQPVYTVQGRERALLKQQLETAQKSAAFDYSRLNAIKAQREVDAIKAPAGNDALHKDAARQVFAGSGPDRVARLKLYDDALARAEADAAAAAVLSRIQQRDSK